MLLNPTFFLQMRKLRPEEMKYLSFYSLPRQHFPKCVSYILVAGNSLQKVKAVGRSGGGQGVHRAQGFCSQINLGKPKHHVTLLDIHNAQ